MTVKDGDAMVWSMPSGATLTLISSAGLRPDMQVVLVLPVVREWHPVPAILGAPAIIYPIMVL